LIFFSSGDVLFSGPLFAISLGVTFLRRA